MQVHYGKQLNAIQYIGEEDRVVRELLSIPLPTVKKGDILIVTEQTAKFLSRPGSPFKKVDISTLIETDDRDKINQISDDAVAMVNKLNQTILELEGQLQIKKDELEGFELRQNDEMEELKKLNQELNEKLELSKDEAQAEAERLTALIPIPKTTKKAPKEETL